MFNNSGAQLRIFAICNHKQFDTYKWACVDNNKGLGYESNYGASHMHGYDTHHADNCHNKPRPVLHIL